MSSAAPENPGQLGGEQPADPGVDPDALAGALPDQNIPLLVNPVHQVAPAERDQNLDIDIRAGQFRGNALNQLGMPWPVLADTWVRPTRRSAPMGL